MKLAILYGGTSNERSVSINTAKSIIKYINTKKYEIESIDFDGSSESLISQLKENSFDLVFNALHGGDGENGELQKLFEQNNIIYTGSDSISSGIAMDKHKSKRICIENNIPTPRWGIVDSSDRDCLEIIDKVVDSNKDLSVVLKPINEGSSFDLFIHDNPFNASKKLTDDFKNHHSHLLNKYGKRAPNLVTMDLSLSKEIQLRDHRMMFGMNVYNLFDKPYTIDIYPITGNADKPGEY